VLKKKQTILSQLHLKELLLKNFLKERMKNSKPILLNGKESG